jgi:hypothetical protein
VCTIGWIGGLLVRVLIFFEREEKWEFIMHLLFNEEIASMSFFLSLKLYKEKRIKN